LLLFDELILLATGGLLIYAGPTNEVVDHFTGIPNTGIHFPAQTNPADILLDMISRDESGNYPFPNATPEVLADAHRARAARSLVGPGNNGRAGPGMEAYKRLTPSWLHGAGIFAARSTVQLAARARQLAVQAILLLVATFALQLISSESEFESFLTRIPLALLCVFLFGGMAAQRSFGGKERIMSWREASVGAHTVPYFLGKDCVALVEVIIMGLTFAIGFGPFSGSSHVSTQDWFLVSISFVYAVYGLNFIFSICLKPATAQMVGLVACMLGVLLTGAEPSKLSISGVLGGYGSLLYSFSPTQWAFGYLFWCEAVNLSPLVKTAASAVALDRGFDLLTVKSPNPRDEADFVRWQAGSGWVCGVGQLVGLGLTFRFYAACCLILVLQLQVGGIQAVCGPPKGKRLLRILSRCRLTLIIWGLLLAFILHLYILMSFRTCCDV